MIINIIGKIMILLALLMILPMMVSVVYREDLRNILSFLVPITNVGIS